MVKGTQTICPLITLWVYQLLTLLLLWESFKCYIGISVSSSLLLPCIWRLGVSILRLSTILIFEFVFVSKSNIKIVERGKIDICNTPMHDLSHSLHGTGTSIKSVGYKLVLWAQTSTLSEMMRPCKCFPRARTMPSLIYKWLMCICV